MSLQSLHHLICQFMNPSMLSVLSPVQSSLKSILPNKILVNSGRASAIAVLLASSTPALAQDAAPSILDSASQTQLRYAPPPGTTTPASSGGTGSRGGCLYKRDFPPLASLTGQQHLSWTVSDRSTIWIYVPYTPEEAPSGTLSIQLGEDEVYRGEFALAATPGIVGIDLPETAPPLEVGQNYSWFININCAPAVADRIVAEVVPAELDGFMQRVTMSDALNQDLSNATSDLDRAAAYGEHHIWYDMLTELARLRLADEANAELDTLWADLLSNTETVNLGKFTKEPLVGEVTAEAVE